MDVAQRKTKLERLLMRLLFWMPGARQGFLRSNTIQQYLECEAVPKLNLTAGHGILDSWLNADLYSAVPLSRYDNAIFMDATKSWPLPNNAFKFVLCEHGIEHFTYLQIQHILIECNRVCAMGGRVRFITPNLTTLIQLFNGQLTAAQQTYLSGVLREFCPDDVADENPAMVLNNSFGNFGHKFLFDERTMKDLLNRFGFEGLTLHKPNVTETLEFKNTEGRVSEWNDFEAMAYEAVKMREVGREAIRRWNYSD